MPGEWGYGPEHTSGDSLNPPVIPHPDLYAEVDEEEDVVSSGLNSPASLTTPPLKPETLPSRAASVRSAGGSAVSRRTEGVGASGHSRVGGSQAGGSRAGSALSTAGGPSRRGPEGAYQPDWEEVYRASFSVPLKYPQQPPHDIQSAIGSAPSKTPSNKGYASTLSMSTSRGGQ
jgi:hypothetical protein